ncbi:MAG: hypothetical protein ABI718_03340 [Acidobacteriota bacterium]
MDSLKARIRELLPELEGVYIDIHAHPELPFAETRTARLVVQRLRA